MSETGTQGTPSGESQAGAGAPAPGDPGAGATGASDADSFASERALLEQQRQSWQGRADRAEQELAALKAAQSQTPAPNAEPTPPASPVDVASLVRQELRRAAEITSVTGALREQFPYAGSVLDRSDSFDNVEQLKVAAENEHKRIEALIGPALTAAAEAATKPYVERFGALQAPPAGAAPGEGLGLPTLAEVERMSLSEQDALEKAHPGHIESLHREALQRLI